MNIVGRIGIHLPYAKNFGEHYRIIGNRTPNPARLIVAKEHQHTPVGSLILACALSLLPGGKPRLVFDAVAHVHIFDSTVREAPFVGATDDVVEGGVRALRCANAMPVFSGCKGQTAGHGRLPPFTNPCWV